jgi:hypothetical protein
MVVEKEVVLAVLERGDDRQDVVVSGLRDIAMSGNVSIN